jgi:phospholipase/lecithinase/hemolysin
MIIGGLPPIGCAPIQITANFKPPYSRTCVQEQNLDAQSYNQKLANLVPRVQQSLPGSRLIFSDTYELLYDMINNPQKYGMAPYVDYSSHSFFIDCHSVF